jgi:hypothetical protein
LGQEELELEKYKLWEQCFATEELLVSDGILEERI